MPVPLIIAIALLVGFSSPTLADATWTLERLAGGTGFGTIEFPGVVVDGDDIPHISFVGSVNRCFFYKTPQSGNWNTSYITCNRVRKASSPCFENGTIPHAVFVESDSFNLYHAVLIGDTWNIDLIDSSALAIPKIVTEDDGTLHVIYRSASPLGFLVYARRDSTEWNMDTLSTLQSSGVYTGMAIDSVGIPHVVYAVPGGSLKYTRCPSGTWVTETVDSRVGFTQFLSIAVTSSGIAHIASEFRDTVGTDTLFHFTNESGHWVKSVRTVGLASLGISIAVSEDSVPAIAYSAWPSGLFFSSRGQLGWSTDLVDNVSGPGSPSLAMDSNGNPHIAYNRHSIQHLMYATLLVVTGVDSPHTVPKVERALVGVTPNPFNPTTKIQYSVPVAGEVRMGIHDVTGRLVATLIDGHIDAGAHTITWTGRNSTGGEAASGTYFVRIESAGDVMTRKITLVR